MLMLRGLLILWTEELILWITLNNRSSAVYSLSADIYLWEEVVRGIVKNDDKGEDVTNCGVEDSHGTFMWH